jgi:hypothetical protein
LIWTIDSKRFNTARSRIDLYEHDCTGQLDLRERQGHYVWADCEEAAWGKMALKFPQEVFAGFTVEKWKRFNVRVVEAPNGKK